LILDHKRGIRAGKQDRIRFALRGGKLVTRDEDDSIEVTYYRPGR
jgi:hypothetical protein